MTRQRLHKLLLSVVGTIVLVAGIIMIPFPGPGWLVVFFGLSILAKVFPWAQRLLDYGKHKYELWEGWLAKQYWAMKLLVLTITGVFIVLILYLINVFGMANSLLDLKQNWLISPLFPQ